MSLNIALQNVKKSFKDYTIYFLTLTFGVCIFYIFNSIESQQAIMELTSSQSLALSTLSRMMDVVSAFISCILAFLIIYANGFLIKRRKKEFGIYMTLGMGKGRISRILICETVLVGILSLVTGLVLGIFLSQGMAIVTAGLIGANIKGFSFVFSPSAANDAIAYFGLTFIIVLAFNVITIRRQRLINLIYADRKNEHFKPPRLKLSICVFIAALILIISAYRTITRPGLFPTGPVISIAACLGVVGTFLFFFSLSGFFLKLLQQSKNVYLTRLNMFVLRQLNSKINTAYVSITFVCLMLFVAICTLSSGIGLTSAIKADMGKSAPYSATFTVAAQTDGADDSAQRYDGLDIAAALAADGIDINSFAREYLEARYYASDAKFMLNLHAGMPADMPIEYIKLSDYNRLLEMQGLPPITLEAEEFAVNCGMTGNLPRLVKESIGLNSALTLNGAALRTGPDLFMDNALETSPNGVYAIIFVVNDALLEGIPAARDTLHINYIADSGEYERLCVSSLKKLDLAAYLPGYSSARFSSGTETRTDVLEKTSEATTAIAYLAVYLGMIFLIASATVLAITQLSETSDNVRRYGLLRKLGADDRMIGGALFSQILIYFGAPLALALVHSAVGIGVAARLAGTLGEMSIIGSSVFTAGVIVLIYGGYFLSTYWGSKNIINKEYIQQRG
ncbi:MAG: ABC transporter permease [Clostridiales Family XIII bacterium]|nr:ABC transporter permease [Clostridiales Family XIII bacterium]